MSIFASIFCIVRDLSALEVVVYYLLIGKMVGLGYWDGFPMVSILVCMVAHWIGLMVCYDLTLSSSHGSTKQLHYVVSQP